MKIVNLDTTTDAQSWCKTWPPNGSSRMRAKQKLLRRRTGVKKVFQAARTAESHLDYGSLEFGESREDLPWNHRASNISSIRDECFCGKSGTQNKRKNLCCIVTIRLGWKTDGCFHEILLLSAECSRLLWQMGKHHKKGDVENFITFRSGQWLKNVRSLQEASQGSTNLVRRFHTEYSTDMHWSRGEFRKFWTQTLRSWKI